MRDLHDISVNRIAGSGCKIDDPLRDLDIESLKVEDYCAVSQKCICDFSRVVDRCGLNDAYFHSCLRILLLNLPGNRRGFTLVSGGSAETLSGSRRGNRFLILSEIIERC